MKKQRIETRKMLLFLPLLVLPLMAGAFYALGGGNKKEVVAVHSAGINTALPDAKFKVDTLSGKMSAYDEQEKNKKDTSLSGISEMAGRLGFSGMVEDPQAKAVEERLAMLNRELSKPYSGSSENSAVSKYSGAGIAKSDAGIAKDVDKLEMLMKNMQGNGEDAEMKQLSGILQRIQDIQQPDLARQKYGVAVGSVRDSQFVAIPAIVDGNQKAVQGSVVKLKLLDSIVVGGVVIPKGHNIYSLGSFSNQRLNLEIKNIRIGNSIVPVNLTVFDLRDAMVGINAPEAVLSDAVSGGVVDAAGSIGLTGFDLTTQLAGAGIDAARSLLTKKLKRVKQPLKAGYPLLLRDNSKKILR